jgi:hypothetical protein
VHLKPTFIERQYSVAADAYFGFYGLIVAVLLTVLAGSRLGSSMTLAWAASMVVSILIFCFFIWRHLYIASLLKTRDATLETLAVQHAQQWTYEPEPPVAPEFAVSSLMDLARRDLQTDNYIRTADWSYTDLSYAVYQQTRNGEYKQATIYYAVMAAELPRVLPNVLFASRQDGSRQFKAKFAADQRHQLEGDFNDYFDTYFAEGYTIDSMSFITPDVMQALVAADKYDIEIVSNALLLYGPMSEADAQLQEMSRLIAAIKQTLLVTVADYRDERLPEDIGSQTVTAQGMFLKQRQVHFTVGAAVVIIYVLVRIGLAVFAHH